MPTPGSFQPGERGAAGTGRTIVMLTNRLFPILAVNVGLIRPAA